VTTIDTRGREFEILHQVTELMDELKPEHQRQIMALLAARYVMALRNQKSAKRQRFPLQPGQRSR
jgi:hypothetical protein